MAKISVVGSINIDLVIRTEKKPEIGETVLGNSFRMYPGGKGANQAITIARLGGAVQMFGCVGDDPNAEPMKDNLQTNGVIIDNIKKISGVSTGTAVITLVDGDNFIIVDKGANQFVDRTYIDTVLPNLLSSEYVLMQNEIPIDTVEYVAKLCSNNSIPVVINPAPYVKMKQRIFEYVNYFTPNEQEAFLMFGPYDNLEDLLFDYPGKVIVTLGERGVAYSNGKKIVSVPVVDKVKVVDTTGAGDVFSGALVKFLCDGFHLKDAVEMAQRASSFSVEKYGAQEGMLTLEEFQRRISVKQSRTKNLYNNEDLHS